MECVPGSLRAACQISVKSVMSALFMNLYVRPLYHLTIFSLHCNAHTASNLMATNCNITSCLVGKITISLSCL